LFFLFNLCTLVFLVHFVFSSWFVFIYAAMFLRLMLVMILMKSSL
jgi:hypothetical protein